MPDLIEPALLLDVSEETVRGAADVVSLQPPLIPTPAKLKARKSADVSLAFEDEEAYISLGGETCTMCGQKCNSVKSLQEHIVNKHCTQSSQVLELLKMQQQIMNTILTNQSTLEKVMNKITTTQTCVLSDIKQLKTTVVSSLRASRPAAPPVPVLPAVSAPPAVTWPAPPPVPLVSGPPPAPLQTPARQILPNRRTKKHKILAVGDSIFHNQHKDILSRETVTDITFVKAYGSVESNEPGVMDPKKNFTDVVPRELSKSDYTALILQQASTPLTNCKANGLSDSKKKEVGENTAKQMFAVAIGAAVSYPDLERVVLTEAVPRLDEMREAAEHGNQVLHRLLQEAEPSVRQKVVIAKHSLVVGGVKGVKEARYGTPATHRNYDGVHLRGGSGRIATTKSFVSILRSAGLAAETDSPANWLAPGPVFQRKKQTAEGGRRQQQQQFRLPTQNRFSLLQGNC